MNTLEKHPIPSTGGIEVLHKRFDKLQALTQRVREKRQIKRDLLEMDLFDDFFPDDGN
jgi:hypothetical protein